MKQAIGDLILNDDMDTALDFLLSLSYGYERGELGLALLSAGWDIYALQTKDDLLGVVLVKEVEGHIEISPTFKGKWNPGKIMPALCSFLNVTTTFVPHATPKAARVCHFLERYGWHVCKTDALGSHLARQREEV